MIVAVCPKCGSDLEALTYTTYPPIHAYRCRSCGWTQEERENITRVPIATVERKPITNADRIRSMTDEELAQFIWDAMDMICPNNCYEYPERLCAVCILDWLKQEATND